MQLQVAASVQRAGIGPLRPMRCQSLFRGRRSSRHRTKRRLGLARARLDRHVWAGNANWRSFEVASKDLPTATGRYLPTHNIPSRLRLCSTGGPE
jgi:hypothetical protein